MAQAHRRTQMDDARIRSLAKPGAACLCLLILFDVCLLHAQPILLPHAAFQDREAQSTVTTQKAASVQNEQTQESGKPANPSDLAVVKSHSAPAVRPRPFLRLATILLVGLVVSAARLARKFRHFLGLGVFANVYSAVFLALAVGISGFPVTFDLNSQLGPWVGPIADLSGVIVALVLPAASRRKNVADGPALGLNSTSSNPVLAAIEDGIRDHILARMQAEIVSAAHRYTWAQIKLAGHRVLEEEVTVGRLDHQDGEAAIRSIEDFQASADPNTDFENKYTALIRLLRSCAFSRLRLGLAVAALESA